MGTLGVVRKTTQEALFLNPSSRRGVAQMARARLS